MAQPIKVRKSAAARASASASTLHATGIDIDPVEQARKLQFMHRLGMALLAIVFGLLNVALLFAQPRAVIPAAVISALAYAAILFFARLALARSLAALMTWHYCERAAHGGEVQARLLQTLLERLTVEP